MREPSGDGSGPDDDRRARVATMAEVAEVAGVSTSTVSRYLRGQPVRNAEAVGAAVKRLNYQPNAAARGLRLRTTEAVAVVVHDITNPYAAALVRGVQSVVAPQWFNLYLAGGPADLETVILNLGGRVDGIICAAATTGSHVIEALQQTGKPAVLVEFEPTDHPHDFDVVVLDNSGGARAAIEKLIELGHERIGVVAGPDRISVGRERLLGAEQAARASSRPVRLLVERSDFSFEGGYQATARLMAQGRDQTPTAIFTPNNLTSWGCLHCLHDLGVQLPEDLSFIGFDPLPYCELLNPPPSTVERPESEQGALAMRLLESRMHGRGSRTPRRIMLDTQLELRGSSAPPKA